MIQCQKFYKSYGKNQVGTFCKEVFRQEIYSKCAVFTLILVWIIACLVSGPTGPAIL